MTAKIPKEVIKKIVDFIEEINIKDDDEYEIYLSCYPVGMLRTLQIAYNIPFGDNYSMIYESIIDYINTQKQLKGDNNCYKFSIEELPSWIESLKSEDEWLLDCRRLQKLRLEERLKKANN